MIYEAFFIQEQLDSTLEKDIQNKHITTEFRPKQTHQDLYGKTATFKVIGYGNDDKNEGFKVEMVSCEDVALKELFDNIPLPHITLSVSNDGKPVNTAKLDFQPVNGQIVTGKFGGFDNGTVVYK